MPQADKLIDKLIDAEVNEKAKRLEKYRRKAIDLIFNELYSDDDPKYDSSNYAFLESLSVPQLIDKLFTL